VSVPQSIRKQFLDRFDKLITDGTQIRESMNLQETMRVGNSEASSSIYTEVPDPQRLSKWETNCLTLFDKFTKHGTKLKERVDEFCHASDSKTGVQVRLGILEAFRDDFEQGFLDDLLLKVEAAVAADYMGQAEGLLKEGQPGKFDHVPAAVLVGAVLEKALRTLCNEQQPPVSIVNAKGEPKTLNPLIDELKKAGAFNELKAKQLRSWAGVRNAAAHGEFSAFGKADVEQMISGINNFLADYLK
jgi:hypothetical protein